jgi:hypothetical protein
MPEQRHPPCCCDRGVLAVIVARVHSNGASIAAPSITIRAGRVVRGKLRVLTQRVNRKLAHHGKKLCSTRIMAPVDGACAFVLLRAL